jgi:hypothetical protein
MPMIFGCVNGPEETESTLRSHVTPAHGRPSWTRFAGGWFAATAHGGRAATWQDAEGRAWAVFGERRLSAAATEDDDRGYGLDVRGDLALSRHARGVVACFDAHRRRLIVRCDPLNYFPLFYEHSRGALLFGSHLWALSRVAGAAPDHTGMMEFMRGNWCLNGRTLFSGIRKLLPGQTLSFDASAGRLSVSETSQLWAGVADDSRAPSDEQIWEHLLEATRTNWHPEGKAGLMLSGGWDSRIMLAALKHVYGDRLVTLSHGAPGHRELELAKGLANRVGARHLEVFLGPDSMGRPDDLDTVLETTDTLMFPWWRYGSKALGEAGCDVGFSGLLGEVLGGHYTVVGRGRSRRAKEVFRRSVLRSAKQVLSPADGLRKVLSQDFRQRNIPFLKHEVSVALHREIAAGIEEDMEGVVTRYQQRGIGDAGRMVEAYNTEYRALDYFCQQPMMLTAQLDVALPLGSRLVVEDILAVPLSRRIHNSLSRNLLRKFQPELLELPLAASPFVPASAPILIQEGGRVARWVVDRISRRSYLLSGGRVGTMRRFGWMDFESHVRAGDFLDTWRDSLTWDGLDRQAIDRYITRIRTHQARVSLARPILKLAYLDRMFGRDINQPAVTQRTGR